MAGICSIDVLFSIRNEKNCGLLYHYIRHLTAWYNYDLHLIYPKFQLGKCK